MALTNFAALTNEQLTVWSRDMWKAARNNSFMNQFSGDGPNSMIQRISELKKTDKGARAVLTLIADLEGDGVAGDRSLEGNEEALVSRDQVIRIDQLRHANRHEGRIADQKSVVTFRSNSKDVLSYWLADRHDQLAFLTLSGVSYTQNTNGATRVGSDLPFLEYAADVTAPSTNRHRRWQATSKTLEAGDTSAVIATDTPEWATFVEAKAYMKDNFIRPIKGDDGQELYHVFMCPRGFAKLKLDADFLAAYRHALPRSKDNPLFKGITTGIMVDGLMFHEFRHVYNTTGLTGGVDKWGAGNDVEGQRIIIAGSQAMGFADIGDPYWVEKEFDYNNQPGISVGKMSGLLKPRFHSQFNNSVEDFGLLVLDTAI